MTTVENFIFFDNVTATGDSPSLTVSNGESLVLCVSGTFVGTLVVKGTQGNVANTLTVVDLSDISKSAASITAAGAYTVVSPYGFDEITVSISEYTSGSITVTGKLVCG